MEGLRQKIKNETIVTSTGCWEWSKWRDRDGYGNIRYGKGSRRAHRRSYEAFKGPIPKGLVVRHLCDNPPCCNPDHLEVGTNADNVRDREVRGRGAKGVNNGTSILTEEIIKQIRAEYIPQKVTQQYLADKYGVSRGLIGHIVNYRIWREV